MATVFINEFHYDNAGTDTGEFIEIAGEAGTDLSGWTLALYNGSNGLVYSTTSLSGVIADQQGGFGTLSFSYPANGIQNGAPDAIALVDDTGTVVQFLSYEGTLTAQDGPALGQTSTDIGAAQDGTDPVGSSLQLTGTGNGYGDFTWTATTASTAGAVNTGQSFDSDPPPPPAVAIYDIQGAGHTSSYVGQVVTTSGIVTAVDSNGYYLQDATGDGSIATSDAIFVFTSSRPTVAVGDQLEVRGSVAEFQPGGASTNNLTTTELTGTTFTVLSTGNALPAAVELGLAGRLPPTQVIDDDGFTSFDPTTDGIDFYESLEGMRVTVSDAIAVSGTNEFGEIFTLVDNGAVATGESQRGTINISPDDFNPERVQIQGDTGILPGFTIPQVDAGARLGDVTGVVTYNFGNFEVAVTEAFTPVADSTLARETTALTGGLEQLTLATYNVLNLSPADEASGQFDALAAHIVGNLKLPDVLTLEEIQDNDGATNSTGTSARDTLQLLVDKIAALSGVHYDFIDNPFVGDDSNGGEPGANIRVVQLYNPDRVDLSLGSIVPVTDPATQQDGTDGNNPFDDSRPPLAATFGFNGQEITVVGNHLSSKGGSAPLFGLLQPSVGDEANGHGQEEPSINGSLDQRIAQAEALRDFVDAILAGDGDANVVVLGDFNEFEFISPLNILEQSLINLTETLPANERYSYIFDGNSQSLDHILVSDALDGAEVDIVHINAEFRATEQASDHDPVLARLALGFDGVVIAGSVRADTLNGADDADLISGGLGNDTVYGRAGDDALTGGDGDDHLFASDGHDRLAGNAGNDSMRSGLGQDTLLGGSGDDSMFGLGGNDLLDGGYGNDQLAGNLGADTFVLRAGAGTDTILDYKDGVDRFLLVNGLTFDELTFNDTGTTTEIAFGSEILAVLLQSAVTLGAEDFATPLDDPMTV